jgi:adenylate kinase
VRFAKVRVVLMGPPGVGKGTQAEKLQALLDVPHISTGNILRAAIQQEGSALGRQAREYVESGRLVPDPLMGELIADRLGRKDTAAGFILDGFPRTLEQVGILEKVLGRVGQPLDRVLMLVAPEGEIVRRLSGRRTCPSCGAVYHLESRPPAASGVCDVCGAALVQRPDDTEGVIRERLKVYDDQTLPVAAAYRAKGILVEVDGLGEVDSVGARLSAGLGKGMARS